MISTSGVSEPMFISMSKRILLRGERAGQPQGARWPKVTGSFLSVIRAAGWVTLDPDRRRPTERILRRVTKPTDRHGAVYAAVLVEGMIRAGDPVENLIEQPFNRR